METSELPKDIVNQKDLTLARNARAGMLEILRGAYDNGKGIKTEKGAKEAAYLLADRAWPVSLSAQQEVSIEGKTLQITLGARRLSGKTDKAQIRLMNVDLPIYLEIEAGNGEKLIIDNLMGSGLTVNTFAYRVDSNRKPIPGSQKIGLDQVLDIEDIPVKQIFSYYASLHLD